MFEYTLNNHFKFGYNKMWFADRQATTDMWSVRYGQCTRPVKSFREECIQAAADIWERRDGLPIDVLFSGGSDSEIVLRSFLELGVPVNVHIMRFSNYVNAHDWCYAYVICQNLNITPIFHDLDLVDFWKSGKCLSYAEISRSVSPQLLPHMWLMDQVDGIPVMGSGESYTARTDVAELRDKQLTANMYPLNVKWALFEREKIAAWYRYAMKTNKKAIPGFFQYSPELLLSFLVDPKMNELHANKVFGKLSNKSTKFDIYKTHWPELIDRNKWSGFELVEPIDKVIRTDLRMMYGDYEHEYWTDVASLIAYLKKNRSLMPDSVAPNRPNPSVLNVDLK